MEPGEGRSEDRDDAGNGIGVTDLGIHTMTAEEYHADPAERPSLSSSIARTLVGFSPLHAWSAHPRLNPDWKPADSEAHFDLGNVVHSMLLDGSVENVEIVLFDDWRTKEAKEQRDEARENGKTPLLAKHYEQAQKIVAGIREQIEWLNVTPALLDSGKPEQTLVWEDHGVLCRARLDWLRDDYAAIDDVKTTGRSASPEQFSRSLFGLGYDVQAAMYQRAVLALTGEVAELRFVVAETHAPYAVSVVSLSPGSLMLANKKLDYALDSWARCLREDSWPGYPTEVCYAETPSWLEAQWLERELEEAA